ncbi:hypothetical protein evm_000436 [Chilo suppressalis]|nr:hypothetical protein evm_000436 [Chilo suppressalis]
MSIKQPLMNQHFHSNYDLTTSVAECLTKSESTSRNQSKKSNTNSYERFSKTRDSNCSCDSKSSSPSTRTRESLIRVSSKISKDLKSVKSRSNHETPLNKALGDVNKAVSFDKRCDDRISELMEMQKELQHQIQQLEDKEVEGLTKLKEAKSIWPRMEDSYEKKIQIALEKQKATMQKLTEVESSMTKWRKSKKILDIEIKSLNKYHQELKDLIRVKSNNITFMKNEIETLKNKIEGTKKQIKAVNETIKNKKKTSDDRIKSLSTEISRIKKLVYEEQKRKSDREIEGSKCIEEGREDLYKIYRIMLQKKLENEHLGTEREDLKHEIDFLKTTCEQCKQKCQNKDEALLGEIAKVDEEIADFKFRCVPCHKCIDTSDVRKFCTDCPRCVQEKYCLFDDGHCLVDVANECICESTKEKFMKNVFKNMNTILESQTQTSTGKAIADKILSYLKRSRNGKLNEETRKILQNFILTTIKNNLNSTIIGGAMKTRCEMDPDTYKRLMLCLQGIQISRPHKEDKETVPRKEPCRRWGETSECNCPKGPKCCPCTKMTYTSDSKTCNDTQRALGEVTLCPRGVSVSCGPDCVVRTDLKSDSEMKSGKQAPCINKKCPYVKNTTAVQCILEQNYLKQPTQAANTDAPYASEILMIYNQVST